VSTGSGSVTGMTVTLAFEAFAKAIPCLTPFLAISDPSVLKRILAYIRRLLCSSNIFLRKVILTYGPIVAVGLSALISEPGEWPSVTQAGSEARAKHKDRPKAACLKLAVAVSTKKCTTTSCCQQSRLRSPLESDKRVRQRATVALRAATNN
jgi:hypothetical protein